MILIGLFIGTINGIIQGGNMKQFYDFTVKDIHPLYQFLTSKETNPEFAGKITWNFNKFLLNRQGKCINRFPSKLEPLSSELISSLEKTLAEK